MLIDLERLLNLGASDDFYRYIKMGLQIEPNNPGFLARFGNLSWNDSRVQIIRIKYLKASDRYTLSFPSSVELKSWQISNGFFLGLKEITATLIIIKKHMKMKNVLQLVKNVLLVNNVF